MTKTLKPGMIVKYTSCSTFLGKHRYQITDVLPIVGNPSVKKVTGRRITKKGKPIGPVMELGTSGDFVKVVE